MRNNMIHGMSMVTPMRFLVLYLLSQAQEKDDYTRNALDPAREIGPHEWE